MPSLYQKPDETAKMVNLEEDQEYVKLRNEIR